MTRKHTEIIAALIGIAAAAALMGCAAPVSVPGGYFALAGELDAYRPAVADAPATVSITWHAVPDAEQQCAALLGHPAPACAEWSKGRTECKIITRDVVNSVVIGHEVRHCFEGAFH